MSIKTWPKLERPREKLLHSGAAILSDAELLAILLRTGIKGKTAVDLARDLLTRFGNLRTLLQTPFVVLKQTAGIGMTKYTQFQVLLELNRRYWLEQAKIVSPLVDSKTTQQYLLTQLGDIKHEVFGCIFLNAKNQIIKFQELFRGSIDHAEIYPRELVKTTLEHHAAALILVHNHPSGDPKPSPTDIALTKRLIAALELVEVKILDHIIVGQHQTFSLAEWGLL